MAGEAYQYVTGPCHLFGNFGGTVLYIGTAETHPIFRERPTYSRVLNDLGGAIVPFDKLYEGTDGIVVAKVNRFQYLAYDAMKSRPRHQQGGFVGENSRLDVGSLLIGNGLAFQLTLYWPFFNTVNAFPGMPPGYAFYAAELEGPDDIEMGTVPHSVNMVWSVNRVYDRVTRKFGLYTQLPAAFTGLDSLIN